MIHEFNLNKIIKTNSESHFTQLTPASLLLNNPDGKTEFISFMKIIFDDSAASFYGNILW